MPSSIFQIASGILSIVPYIILLIASIVYFKRTPSTEVDLIRAGSLLVLFFAVFRVAFATIALRFIAFESRTTSWILAAFSIGHIIAMFVFSVGLMTPECSRH